MTPSLRSAASHGEVGEAHESSSARLLYPQGYYKNARGTQAEKGTWMGRRALRAFAIGLSLISLTSATCLLLSLQSQLKVAPLRLATGRCEPVTTDHLDGMVYTCTGEGCDSSLLCHSMSLLRATGRARFTSSQTGRTLSPNPLAKATGLNTVSWWLRRRPP